MTSRRDIVTVVLVTFCLTVALFSVIPTLSLPQYDPWIDVNDDGVIDVKDYQMVKSNIPSMGTSINKTAKLLELESEIDQLNNSLLNQEAYFKTEIGVLNTSIVGLQSRIDGLDASLIALESRVEALETSVTILETRMPRKGRIIVSPTTFMPQTDSEFYYCNGTSIYGKGGGIFYAALGLPNGATIKNVTARFYDGMLGRYQMNLTLLRCSLGGSVDTMARILYYGSGAAPGIVDQFEDTIIYPVVDSQNYMYTLQLWFQIENTNLRLYWVTLDYEY